MWPYVPSYQQSYRISINKLGAFMDEFYTFYSYCRSFYPRNNDPFLLSNLLIQYMWYEHLRAIDVTERIDGCVDIDGRRKENLDSRGISSTHKASSDETGGKIFEESTEKNQEQGMWKIAFYILWIFEIKYWLQIMRNCECHVKDIDLCDTFCRYRRRNRVGKRKNTWTAWRGESRCWQTRIPRTEIGWILWKTQIVNCWKSCNVFRPFCSYNSLRFICLSTAQVYIWYHRILFPMIIRISRNWFYLLRTS